eukprot:TRINITY_DN61485_c0_g1_i1.p3 TRINITY_DN61485_c0_g1~~TRINITY_DN61485_c0_g1_i1.p3  ORF type:complete len:140 (+),score=54.18 TRINITY_DN61485_c0_g1_i1:187-606(+)
MVVKGKINKDKGASGSGGSRGSTSAEPGTLEAALAGKKEAAHPVDQEMDEEAAEDTKAGKKAPKRQRGGAKTSNMTEEGYHNLVALIARLGLNLATQTRILRSVAQQTLTMPDNIKLVGSEFTFMQEIKQVSKNYFNKI